MRQQKIQQTEREKQRVYTIKNDGSLSLDEKDCGFDKMTYFGEEDIDAISVYDYLHTDENDEFYRKNNVEFASVVDNVLRRQTFNIAIKRVLTANDNTSLRLKNVNYEMGPEFREFTNSRPVVLARGLWSNLFSWEGLAREIARGEGTDEYRDAWLIEITGGPNTECESCPNYNFTDLTNFYWPALIGGVQAYTGESEVDYVGFSNGCRTALGSLEEWQENGKSDVGYYMNGSDWVKMGMSSDVVHTFVGVGCPGAFEGSSYLTKKVNNNPGSANKLGKRSLKRCVLYTTCEPCPMCFYMAWITGVSKIVFGASNKDAIKHGFDEIDITDRELNRRGGRRIRIEGGCLRDECLGLFG